MDKPRLVNVKRACRYGGFGRTKAFELISDGTIRAVKMGSRTMVDLNTIDRYHESLQPRPRRASSDR